MHAVLSFFVHLGMVTGTEMWCRAVAILLVVSVESLVPPTYRAARLSDVDAISALLAKSFPCVGVPWWSLEPMREKARYAKALTARTASEDGGGTFKIVAVDERDLVVGFVEVRRVK